MDNSEAGSADVEREIGGDRRYPWRRSGDDNGIGARNARGAIREADLEAVAGCRVRQGSCNSRGNARNCKRDWSGEVCSCDSDAYRHGRAFRNCESAGVERDRESAGSRYGESHRGCSLKGCTLVVTNSDAVRAFSDGCVDTQSHLSYGVGNRIRRKRRGYSGWCAIEKREDEGNRRGVVRSNNRNPLNDGLTPSDGERRWRIDKRAVFSNDGEVNVGKLALYFGRHGCGVKAVKRSRERGVRPVDVRHQPGRRDRTSCRDCLAGYHDAAIRIHVLEVDRSREATQAGERDDVRIRSVLGDVEIVVRQRHGE